MQTQNPQNILVVYYSLSGHTAKLAQNITASLNCESEALVDLKKRQGFWHLLLAGKDALQKNQTELAPLQKNPATYDLVIIGTPIWAGRMTPAIRTFINQYKDSFKAVAFFTTSGGKISDAPFQEMAILCQKPAISTLSISEKDATEFHTCYTPKFESFIGKIMSQ